MLQPSDSFSNNWRSKSSAELYDKLVSNLLLFGITRTANITDLDFCEIPVYTSFRPRATTLAVSCGKGLTHIDSIISSIMESIEVDIAESLDSSEYTNSSYKSLPSIHKPPINYLPLLANNIFNKNIEFSWLLCQSLCNSSSLYLPAATISLTHNSIIDPLMTFVWGTNGLASGSNLSDALLSGLYECIERDSLISWQQLISSGMVKESLVDISTIPFQSSLSLIKKITSNSFKLYLFNRVSDTGIPVYKATLHSPHDTTVPLAEGYGCHHLDEIAINRAITEAVQSRTVIIAGSRDDISYYKLRDIGAQNIPDDLSKYYMVENFSASDNIFIDSESAVNDLIERLNILGFKDIFYYPFYVPDDLVSVVRVFIPGLQHYSHRHSVPSSRHIQFAPLLHGIRKTLYDIAKQ
jgi:ribosomal protein S12 methylthiotransferase accessory factor